MYEFVRMENICSPGGLKHATLNVMQGEIVGLLGLNNAGKTEFMEILSGFSRLQKGVVYIDDKAVTLTSPLHAKKLGIHYISSNEALLPDFSVSENIFIMQPGHEKGLVNKNKINRKCDELLSLIHVNESGINITSQTIVKNLDNLQKLAVLIAKAVNNAARLIIIDHLLYEFPQNWTVKLHAFLKNLVNENRLSFILTDCRPSALSFLCDRIFVLREGTMAGCYKPKQYDDDILTSIMTWHRDDDEERAKENILPAGKQILAFQDVVLPFEKYALSFEVCANEAVGLCCLSTGFGDSMSDLLVGLRPAKGGKILLEGREIKLTETENAIRHEIGIVSDKSSVFNNMGLLDNVSLMALKKFSQQGIINKLATLFAVSESLSSWKDSFLIADDNTKIDKFLEKQIVISRNMAIIPKVMVYINLDRGLDRVTYSRIIKQIREASNKPKASLFISPNINNLLSVCSRVYFIRDGRAVKEFSMPKESYEDILSYYRQFCET